MEFDHLPGHRAAPRGERDPLARLTGGLVVSSQAHRPGGPTDSPDFLLRAAMAAELGGAAGFRIRGIEMTRLMRGHTDLPIIGLTKRPGAQVYITPSVEDALALIDAGADIVAADASPSGRPAQSFGLIADACHARGTPVMADCADVPQALAAIAGGADIVSTTMAGYTPDTAGRNLPDLDMLRRLRASTATPIALEGGVWSPEQVARGLELGATFVVVGSAITDPERAVRHFLPPAG